MSTSLPLRPLSIIQKAVRKSRGGRLQIRRASTETLSSTYPPSHIPPYPRPKDFHPGNAYRHHREQALYSRPLPVPACPVRPAKKICPDPIEAVTDAQLRVLDPTGQRAWLFSPANPERVLPGDVLLVRTSDADQAVSGVCLSVRRTTRVDTAVLLRNQLTRVGVEVWVKVFSPNVTAIEVVQRREKRARRARLYYYRKPKHDMGSVEGLVRNYQRQQAFKAASGPAGGKAQQQGRREKVGKKKKR